MAVAELINKRPYVLKTGRIDMANAKATSSTPTRLYTFDIAKVEAIFDQFLVDKLVKLHLGHKFPSLEEMKGKEYCKYHNSWSHTTNNCIVFRNDIQDKIERGEFKFEPKDKKPMGVDSNPFPSSLSTNMVSLNLRGMPRHTPRPNISLEEPSRPTRRPTYDEPTFKEEFMPPPHCRIKQWPSRWSRPVSEIKKLFKPRCSLVCDECGQKVESGRPQLKSVVVRQPESRPKQNSPNRQQQEERRLSVFCRLQPALNGDQRDTYKYEASTSSTRRPRAVKPKNLPSNEWCRVKHPKFPAKRPPLSKS